MQQEAGYISQGSKVYLLVILLLVFAGLAGVAALASWALGRVSQRGQKSAHAKDDALEVLRKRYVRGKITRDQFHLMWRDLTA